jgi:surfeit locus 1 family protein
VSTGSPARRFWLVTCAALAGFVLTVGLGVWQWGRAEQKVARQSGQEQRQSMAVVDGLALPVSGVPLDLLDRPVVVRGTWVKERTVYLDNRQMQGRPGFYVVTPRKLAGSDFAVMVERGWIPRNFEHREQLQPVDTPAGVIEVHGRIAPPPPKLYEFAGAGAGAIRQNLDLGRFREASGLPLLDVAVQQAGPASEGLLRDWPRADSGAATNYGYAFQWWAMSALIAVLYVWFQFIAPRRKSSHA